jgi:hypothetical protein
LGPQYRRFGLVALARKILFKSLQTPPEALSVRKIPFLELSP